MTEFGNDVLSWWRLAFNINRPTIQWNGVNDYDFDQDGCAGWIQEEKPYLLLPVSWNISTAFPTSSVASVSQQKEYLRYFLEHIPTLLEFHKNARKVHRKVHGMSGHFPKIHSGTAQSLKSYREIVTRITGEWPRTVSHPVDVEIYLKLKKHVELGNMTNSEIPLSVLVVMDKWR
nr:8645_t:CDS:2 [Entrophospora candida]